MNKIKPYILAIYAATQGVWRLLIITCFAVIGFFLVVFALRFMVLSGPILKSNMDWPSDAPLVFSESASSDARVVPAIQVYSTPDLKWFVGKAPAEELPLPDYLAKTKPTRLLLFVNSKDQMAAQTLIANIEGQKSLTTVFVAGENHLMNRELRKQRPLWNSAADATELAQWQLFASAWLEPMASNDFEWVLEGSNSENKLKVTERVREEIKRRTIPTVWIDDGTWPQDRKVLGILTSRPTEVLKQLEARQ